MDAKEYGNRSYDFYYDSESEYVKKGWNKVVECLRVDHVFYHKLAVDGCIAAEKQCEETGKSHQSETTGLDKNGKDKQSGRSESL